jgi:hypothetical protein
MTKDKYEKVIVLDGDENADWILGVTSSEKRKKEIKIIESIIDHDCNLQELKQISIKPSIKKKSNNDR